MIEAAEQWFESRPSIRSPSQLIFNACPGMIPFNMSIYAMLGVSLFNLCHCISVVILIASENTISLPPSRYFVCKFVRGGSRTGWRPDIFYSCFFFFFRGKSQQKFRNSHQKGLLHRASSLVITSCRYQSYLSISCWYQNGDHCYTAFRTSNRGFQDFFSARSK